MFEEIDMKEEEREEIVVEIETKIDLIEGNIYDNINIFISLFTGLII